MEDQKKKTPATNALTDNQLEQVAGGADAQPADQPADQIVIIDHQPIHHIVVDTVPKR